MVRPPIASAAVVLLASAVAHAGAPKNTLVLEVPESFMGGVKQAAMLIVKVRNDDSRQIELGYSDLEPYFEIAVTAQNKKVRCRTPKAREKRGAKYQWLIDANKSAVVRIDLLKRCELTTEGTYNVSVRFRVPGKSRRYWSGTTPVVTTILALGGGSGAGPAGNGTVPVGCTAYDSRPPDTAGCSWICGVRPVCSGVARREHPPGPSSQPAYVCNGCMRNADCVAKPKGRCVLLPADTCAAAAYSCVYPGDACFPPATCTQSCFTDDEGHAQCKEPAGMPP